MSVCRGWSSVRSAGSVSMTHPGYRRERFAASCTRGCVRLSNVLTRRERSQSIWPERPAYKGPLTAKGRGPLTAGQIPTPSKTPGQIPNRSGRYRHRFRRREGFTIVHPPVPGAIGRIRAKERTSRTTSGHSFCYFFASRRRPAVWTRRERLQVLPFWRKSRGGRSF